MFLWLTAQPPQVNSTAELMEIGALRQALLRCFAPQAKRVRLLIIVDFQDEPQRGGECNQQMPYYRRKRRWICWKFQWMRSIDPRHALNMTASSTDMTFTYIHSKISQRVQDGESTNVLPEFGPDVLFTTCKREASKLKELAFIIASTHPPLLGQIVFL